MPTPQIKDLIETLQGGDLPKIPSPSGYSLSSAASLHRTQVFEEVIKLSESLPPDPEHQLLTQRLKQLQSEGLRSVWMTVDRALAIEFSKRIHPTAQRKFSVKRGDKYALWNQLGYWKATHQGIAFDREGFLIDGQSRIYGIIKSGKSMNLLVTFGVPTSSFDSFDSGPGRTVADALGSHGHSNETLKAAACRGLQIICTGDVKISTIPTIAYAVLKEYDEHLAKITANRSKLLRSGYTCGAFAFCRNAYRNLTDEFIRLVTEGEGLTKTQPAFWLRDWMYLNMAKKRSAGGTGAGNEYAKAVFTGVKMHILGERVLRVSGKVTPDASAVAFFAAKQRSAVMRVAEACGKITPTKVEANVQSNGSH